MKRLTYLVIGLLIVLVTMTGIILTVGVTNKETPRILVIPSTATCFKNETGLAIVLKSNSTVNVDITRVVAILPQGSTNNVSVYKLYKNGKDLVTLPYHTTLNQNEELPIGLLVQKGGVQAFNLTINGENIQVKTGCKP